MTVTHPDYAILAARIAVSNLHKQTKKQFSSVIDDLYHYANPKNHKPAPMISDKTYETVMKHAEELNSRTILPSAPERQSCRETSADDHAGCCRHSR